MPVKSTPVDQTKTMEWDCGLVELYREQFERLVSLARRAVRSDAIAEELVQDAFLRFHSAQRRPEPGKELSYLRSMVLNSARSATRRTIRGEILHRESITRTPVSVEDSCLTTHESEMLREAIALLSPRQQRVVTLRYLCGLSESETAKRLDITPGSVKTHASRGRAHLRRELVDAGC